MLIIGIIIFVVLSVTAVGVIIRGNKVKSLDSSVGLSQVAKKILSEYDALPKESRPFPEIVTILKSMDFKHAVDSVERDRHFDDHWLPLSRVQSGLYSFSWYARGGSGCNHSRYCKFNDYFNLHLAIASVQDSLDEKARVLAQSIAQPDLEMIAELEARLRDEASINNEFVHQFRRLS